MIFKSKIKASFTLLCLLLLSLYSLKNLRLTRGAQSEYENYTVEFEYFGIDADKIEKVIAIPFEEKIAKLQSLISISSISEYSKCVTNIVLEKQKNSSYASLSDAANELKQALPQDVQNPKIYALALDSKCFFCAAFDKEEFSLEECQEKLLRALKGLPGVCQALVSGGEKKEVQVAFDDKSLAYYGLLPWQLANILQEKKAYFSNRKGYSYRESLESIDHIKNISEISNSCKVSDSFQRKECLARVNGKECLILSLKSSDENQNIRLSRKIRRILKEKLKNRKGWKIIYDNGEEQEKAIRKIVAAFFETLLALTLAVWLMFRSIKKTAIALAFTAFDTLTTVALLSALKIPLDNATISGITISLGLLCDAALYMLDDCKTSQSTLVICSMTTVCAILPLFALNPIVPGIKALGRACSLSIIISALTALIFLPQFLPKKKNKNESNFCLNMYKFLHIKRNRFLNLYPFLYILPIFFFVFLPKNLNSFDSGGVLYAQVEFNPERRLEFVDKDIHELVNKIKKFKEIKYIQSEAKRGQAELQIVLKNTRNKNKVSKLIQKEDENLAGNLYVPLIPSKRKIVQKIQVAILGDDEALCKKIAKEAAVSLQDDIFMVRHKGQVVLNFKEDEKVFVARPEKDLLKSNGISPQELSYFLRWNLFGPVALKFQTKRGQKDIRLGNEGIAFTESQNLENVKNLSLKAIPISALASISKETRPSKFFRKDFRRAAYFTVELESRNSGKAFNNVKKTLQKLSLPDGYYFSWPKEYQSLNENYSKILGAFLISVAAIFFLIAAQCENLNDALHVLLTIPISLFLPLLIRGITFCPLTLGDAVGMVFISGLCVNNALYILGEYKLSKNKDALLATQKLLKSVLSSSITTLVSSVPVMINGDGAFASDLAFFMFFGSIASIFAGLIYFPQTIKKRPVKDGAFD